MSILFTFCFRHISGLGVVQIQRCILLPTIFPVNTKFGDFSYYLQLTFVFKGLTLKFCQCKLWIALINNPLENTGNIFQSSFNVCTAVQTYSNRFLFRIIMSIEVNQRSLCPHPINQLQASIWTVSEVLDLRCDV